jgi:hypothetical protein
MWFTDTFLHSLYHLLNLSICAERYHLLQYLHHTCVYITVQTALPEDIIGELLAQFVVFSKHLRELDVPLLDFSFL